jgi:hypothetical protein
MIASATRIGCSCRWSFGIDERVPIKPEHKMSKAQINKEMNANRFKLVREYDGLPWQQLMFFGKAEEGAVVPVPAPAK